MRSACLIGLIAAGCGFSSMPSSLGDDQGQGPGGVDAGPGGGSGSGSGSGSSSDTGCDAKDSLLRLCLTFDPTAGMVQDLVTPPHTLVDHVGVKQILDLLSAPTARLDATSRIRFAESSDLDVSDLTIEMWVKPDPLQANQHYWMLDNNTQYYAVLDGDGTVRCGIGGTTSVSSQTQINGTTWHHVACTFASSDHTLRVHVDGNVSGCTPSQGQIPTTGGDGLAIGANYGAGNFTENFLGGLEGAHLYARALSANDVCRDAHQSACNTQCPGDDHGPGGPGGGR